MTIYSSSQLDPAMIALKNGDCVGLPTETVYGLAGNALNANAILKIFELKKRPFFDPLIMHVSKEMDLSAWVKVTPLAQKLMDDFWPGPLTLLLKKSDLVPDLMTSGLDTAAIRCPNHPVATAILNGVGFPLAAPSANPFGKISPTTAIDVEKGLGQDLIIVDGGACTIGLGSTIVDASDFDVQANEIKILRKGGLSEVDFRKKGYQHISYPEPLHAQSPGTLKSHYAPNKPLYLLEHPISQEQMAQIRSSKPMKMTQQRFSWLSWAKPLIAHDLQDFKNQALALTDQTGDDRLAAKTLFAKMRLLDESQSDVIFVEPIPLEGLGQAILDRLTRASVGEASFENGEFRIFPSAHTDSSANDHKGHLD